jgi:fermentation-respiration switch protein FrsA (DUF1100 family)
MTTTTATDMAVQASAPPAREPASPTVCEAVSFASGPAHLAGNLFLPRERDASVPLIGAVVTGTWTSVKEQMADRYATKLAERGLAALSFDFTGFGVSGGEPREVESAELKARDIRNAAEFLQSHPAVNAERIAAVAICASAMYAVKAAIDDSRIQALALIAPWLHDAELLRDGYGGEEGVQQRLRAGEAAAQRYKHAGVVDYVPVADAKDPRAAMPMDIDFYTNPQRGKIPGWPNRFAVMAWTEWLNLDAIALAPEVRVPTLLVHSDDAAIPDGARRFHEALTCPKQIVWTEGTQFDFYDQPPTVDDAVGRAAAHLRQHLGVPA